MQYTRDAYGIYPSEFHEMKVNCTNIHFFCGTDLPSVWSHTKATELFLYLLDLNRRF